MSDVTAFLRARLDDDEKIANTAIGRQPEYAEWAYEGDEVFAPRLGERGDRWNVTCDSEGLRPAVEEKDGPHIAYYDPARALPRPPSSEPYRAHLQPHHHGQTTQPASAAPQEPATTGE